MPCKPTYGPLRDAPVCRRDGGRISDQAKFRNADAYALEGRTLIEERLENGLLWAELHSSPWTLREGASPYGLHPDRSGGRRRFRKAVFLTK